MDKQNVADSRIVEYYSVIKRNEIQVQATLWNNLENGMLNVDTRHKGLILYDSIYVKYLVEANS